MVNENDLLETLKITIELVRKLNNEKRDYIKSIVKICIALIISFTIIICCFYALYFTMQEVKTMWEWLQKILFPKEKKKKKDKKGGDK